MELRFIERDGQKILQQLIETDHPHMSEEWVDVPLVSDPTKSRRQEKVGDLTNMLYDHIASGRNGPTGALAMKVAEAALEWVHMHIPSPAPWHEHYSPDQRACIQIRNETLADVRRNLGLDQ